MLELAEDETLPLLERVRFLSIFATPVLLTLWFSRQLFAGDRFVLAAYGGFAFISGAGQSSSSHDGNGCRDR